MCGTPGRAPRVRGRCAFRRLAGSLGLQFRLHARVPAVISLSFGRIISEFLGYSKDISEGGIAFRNLDVVREEQL